MNVEQQRRPGFWARQFAPDATSAQYVFDVSFGVVLPVVCLVADPVVFKGSDFLGGGMFASYALTAYLFVGGSVLAMALWLASQRLATLFAGPFFLGGMVSLVVGVALLPLSLLMALAGIGLLGLVPFGTAFTFLRGSIRARRAALMRHPASRVTAAILLTGALALAVPMATHLYVQARMSGALADVTSDETAVRERGLATLRRFAVVLPDGVGLDRIVWDWREEGDPARKARLAEAYAAVAGGDIRSRFRQLAD